MEPTPRPDRDVFWISGAERVLNLAPCFDPEHPDLDAFDFSIRQVGDPWSEPTFVLARDGAATKGWKIPDISHQSGALMIRAELAEKLLDGFEIPSEKLPMRVEGDAWTIIRPICEPACLDESRSKWISLPDPPVNERYWMIRTAALKDNKALCASIFRIDGNGSGWLYCGGAFRKRVIDLGLVGLGFHRIGYIIDDASPEYVGAGPTDSPLHLKATRPRTPPKLKDLDPDTLSAVAVEGDKLRSKLSLSADAASSSVLEALNTQVAQWHANIGDFKDAADWSVAVAALSSIYGDLLVREFGWSYAQIVVRRGVWHYGVTSPARTHVLALDEFMRRQVQSGDPTLTLQFNMIKAGQLPPVDPAMAPLLLS